MLQRREDKIRTTDIFSYVEHPQPCYILTISIPNVSVLTTSFAVHLPVTIVPVYTPLDASREVICCPVRIPKWKPTALHRVTEDTGIGQWL